MDGIPFLISEELDKENFLFFVFSLVDGKKCSTGFAVVCNIYRNRK